MPTTRVRVLLADDHATVRDALRLLLSGQDDMEVVGEAGDGQAAVTLSGTLRPDVTVLDLSMPTMKGLPAIPAVKRASPSTHVVILTRHDDYFYVHQCLEAGASGYVTKLSPASELLQAIRVVMTGRKYLDSIVAGQVIDAVAPVKQAGERLSAREADVLRLLVRGFSYRDIAAELSITAKTVSAHQANAMGKLGFRSRIELVRFAILQGWLQDE